MRRPRAALWAVLPIAGLLISALLVSGDARDASSALLGDDLRNDLLALYTGLTARETQTADLVPIAHTDVNPYGINVFLEQEVEEWKIRRTLEMAHDAGFHWIKQQVRWSDIETPGKGQYFDTKNNLPDTWHKYDRIVDLAREYGLDLILRLDTSPDWARPGNAKEETPPPRFEDFGDFVYSVVARYKGRVKYYQIWNEPNLAFEWGGRQPDAAQYVQLLRAGYGRAKEADSRSLIIAAALAPTTEISARATNDLVFLQQMYDAGAKQWFDVMGVNAYGLRSGPDDRRLGEASDVNFSRPILVRELMVRNGDAGKAMWASEMGWNALPPDFPGEAPWGRVTRDQQARYTVRAYQRMQEEWPWLGVGALWHFRMVHDVNRDTPQYYFGIVQNDFTPYPAYVEIKGRATSAMVLYPGFHQESHPALSFSGQWQEQNDERATMSGVMVSDVPGDRLQFTFRGSDLDLVVAQEARSGRLTVSVDGGSYAANRLPRDATGHAYADLWSPDAQWQHRIAVARGLPWGPHEVGLQIAAGPHGGTRAAIDGIVVAGTPPDVPRTLAGITVLMAALLVSYGLYRLVVARGWRKMARRTVVRR